jgi:hypothetical protein
MRGPPYPHCRLKNPHCKTPSPNFFGQEISKFKRGNENGSNVQRPELARRSPQGVAPFPLHRPSPVSTKAHQLSNVNCYSAKKITQLSPDLGRVLRFTFPDDQHGPPQLLTHGDVTGYISSELRLANNAGWWKAVFRQAGSRADAKSSRVPR